MLELGLRTSDQYYEPKYFILVKIKIDFGFSIVSIYTLEFPLVNKDLIRTLKFYGRKDPCSKLGKIKKPISKKIVDNLFERINSIKEIIYNFNEPREDVETFYISDHYRKRVHDKIAELAINHMKSLNMEVFKRLVGQHYEILKWN